MTADQRRAALADLDRALAALAAHVHSADEKAVLARLQAEAAQLARLADPGPPSGIKDFDPLRFQRLLDLTGPAMAGMLLLHLADDLQRCRMLVQTGMDRQDWDSLREGSHILISLAGSVGALSLQVMAEALNAASHRHDDPAVLRLVPALIPELDALIALVRATPAPVEGTS